MVPPEYFCRIGILDSNSVLKKQIDNFSCQ